MHAQLAVSSPSEITMQPHSCILDWRENAITGTHPLAGLAALLPCFVVYLEVGKALKRRGEAAALAATVAAAAVMRALAAGRACTLRGGSAATLARRLRLARARASHSMHPAPRTWHLVPCVSAALPPYLPASLPLCRLTPPAVCQLDRQVRGGGV